MRGVGQKKRFKMNEQITRHRHPPDEMSELVSERNLVEKGLQQNPIESWKSLANFDPNADVGNGPCLASPSTQR